MSVSLIVRNTRARPYALRLTLSKLKKLQKTSQFCYTSHQNFSCVGSEYSTRHFSTTYLRGQDASTTSTAKDGASNSSLKLLEEDNPQYRERYMPITRLSIIRILMEEKDFLTDSEKKIFPEFTRALGCSLMNQYRGVLGELKTLFDPINPDKDTLQSREFSRREKLDNEFWLLQQLNEVMKKANFQELPRETVEKRLKEHLSSEGVQVSVDLNRYDVLRFWVLGHEKPKVALSVLERLTNAILRKPPREAMEYYRRVVVAIRLKKDSKLILKAFKEVPIRNIEMLLPDGTVKMSTWDKGVLSTSIAVAGFGILAKVVTYLAHLHVEWTLMVASITGLIGFRAWTLYKNKRNEYLITVTRMLYFKNMANNRGLLALLVDRAEDECFKEALLTYAFLLNSRPAASRNQVRSSSSTDHDQGGLTVEELEDQVQDWIEKKTGSKVHFDTSEAVPLLKDLRLINEKDGKLNAVMLDIGSKILPVVPMSSIVKEDDIMDGFDRNVFLETEEEYDDNAKKESKYGWF